MQAVSVARSYRKARKNSEIEFAYKGGSGVFDGQLSDEHSRGIIDCSTYIGLVLRGISFQKSPYAAISGPGQACAAPRISRETAPCPWADPKLDDPNNILKKPVRTAADLAKYMYCLNRCFTDRKAVKPGDLVFFARKNADGSYRQPKRFLHISHVGILTEVESAECYFLNVTKCDGVVVRTRLSKRPDAIFFCRPNYTE